MQQIYNVFLGHSDTKQNNHFLRWQCAKYKNLNCFEFSSRVIFLQKYNLNICYSTLWFMYQHWHCDIPTQGLLQLQISPRCGCNLRCSLLLPSSGWAMGHHNGHDRVGTGWADKQQEAAAMAGIGTQSSGPKVPLSGWTDRWVAIKALNRIFFIIR